MRTAREALDEAAYWRPNGAHPDAGAEGGAADTPSRRLPVVSGASFAGRAVPRRPWLCEGLIPSRTVTLLGGDGATGKSLLALQLAVACATGGQWIGRAVTEGPALYLGAEDDLAEMHRRLADVMEGEGLGFETLGDLHLSALAGEEAVLAAPNRATGALAATPLFAALDDATAALRPVLVVCDTAADLYGGNENDRAHVRQFVGLLRALAVRHDCAVLLLAHPSVAGMASGSGLSGSTAWSNSVRARLYLSRVVHDDGIEPDANARLLSVKKANYSATGGELPLSYRDGRFVAEARETGLDRMAATARAERVFLRLLRAFTEQGRFVSAQPGPTYAPAIFAKADAEGCTRRALVAAMEALFASGRIVVAQHGSGAKARSHIAEAEGGAS